jgi:hypothetical protein
MLCCLTSRSRVLLDKLIVIRLVKKFFGILWKPKVHESPPFLNILSHIHPVHALPSYFFKIHFNIILCNAWVFQVAVSPIHRGADKSLARPTSRGILFDGENISFDASLVIHINSTNIPPIMIIDRIHENQNLLSLWLVSFLVGLRTYQHPYIK